MPDYVLVLNRERQVLAMNSKLVRDFAISDPDKLIGQRPGEALRCVNFEEGGDGCGSGLHCRTCGAIKSIIDSNQEHQAVSREVRITVNRDEWRSLDLEVVVSPVIIADMDLQLFVMRDISAEKRRRVLEQTFFHDVLNTVGGIRGMASLLADGHILGEEEERLYKIRLIKHSDRLVDEILFQRNLLQAEKGEYKLNSGIVNVGELLEEVQTLFTDHHVAQKRTIVLGEAPHCSFISDWTILRRILGNLLKNALEATPEGGTVMISAIEEQGGVVFSINNPGVMPEAVQMQLFQRSFSTKGEEGRGIGTYSVKLFGERYLKGKVSFTSHEPDGTTFSIFIPKGI
jgi:signal transduction histidine kinase